MSQSNFLTGTEEGDCDVVSGDASELIPLEKQAYANAKDSGVVYDLSWYKTELGVNNPFDRFS